MAFKRATKHESRLRLALAGPSGSGKTYTALSVALALCPGKVALLDTERGSASKYADRFEFDVENVNPPYHPDRLGDLISEAAKAGYGALVVDSLSHFWNGEGGLLELVDNIKKRGQSRNGMDAWRDATPIQQRMIDSLTRAPLHIIATMRAKQSYEIDKNDRGKVEVRKLGLAPVQRDDVEYEFDVYAMIDAESTLTVQKTRCFELSGYVRNKPDGEALAGPLRKWLSGAPAPGPEPIVYGVKGDGGERITEAQHDRCVALLNDARLPVIFSNRLRVRIDQALAGDLSRKELNRAILGCKAACAGTIDAYDAEQAAQDEPTGEPDPLADVPL